MNAFKWIQNPSFFLLDDEKFPTSFISHSHSCNFPICPQFSHLSIRLPRWLQGTTSHIFWLRTGREGNDKDLIACEHVNICFVSLFYNKRKEEKMLSWLDVKLWKENKEQISSIGIWAAFYFRFHLNNVTSTILYNIDQVSFQVLRDTIGY